MADLKDQFTQAMVALYHRTKKELDYSAIRFLQMVQEHGGVEAVLRLVRSPDSSSYGLGVLWEKKRLDLSVEAQMLKPEYASLFDVADLDRARKILEELKYTAPWDTSVQPPSPPGGTAIDPPPTPRPSPSDTSHDFAVGQRVRHRLHGDGRVVAVLSAADGQRVTVQFAKGGPKTFAVGMTKLEKL